MLMRILAWKKENKHTERRACLLYVYECCIYARAHTRRPDHLTINNLKFDVLWPNLIKYLEVNLKTKPYCETKFRPGGDTGKRLKEGLETN